MNELFAFCFLPLNDSVYWRLEFPNCIHASEKEETLEIWTRTHVDETEKLRRELKQSRNSYLRSLCVRSREFSTLILSMQQAVAERYRWFGNEPGKFSRFVSSSNNTHTMCWRVRSQFVACRFGSIVLCFHIKWTEIKLVANECSELSNLFENFMQNWVQCTAIKSASTQIFPLSRVSINFPKNQPSFTTRRLP